MLMLGIDSSSKMASAAVFDCENNKILSEIHSGGNLSHSENLLPMIDYAFKSAGVCVGDINLFAVSNGPGSFTGIRIGVATIKGLAFGCEDNCIAVSSLQALAYNFAGLENNLLILPVIDARRRQVYNAIFGTDLEYIRTERIIPVDELAHELNLNLTGRKIVFTGDGADLCYDEIDFYGKIKIPDILKRPSAAALCAAALHEYKKNGAISANHLAPAYLIKTQAEREYNKK
jgi:tRNA threonylcarbamoyladenosine biosynthesis protein TsaB